MDNGDILQILIQAEFGQKIRGYDPLEVDEVLDQAVVEIERLTQACAQATERAEVAERQFEEEIGPARRNRQESEEVLLGAKEEALRLTSEVEEEISNLRAAAEKEIRGAIEKGRQQMNSEIADLENERKKVNDDIEIIERHIEAHKARLQVA
ncbi:DivIVA domain-containing protein, partial [Acidimicrobiaceae bacterium]|nr:DivIVA domain-containing protein [Acidimicrobiaceae bacterium]